MFDRLGFFKLRVGSLNWKLIICIIRSRIESALIGLTKRGQKLWTALWLDLISLADTTVGGIEANVLPEGNINNFLSSESLIFFEVDFTCEFVMFEKLEERIDFEWEAFLWLWEQNLFSTEASILKVLQLAINMLINSVFFLLGNGNFTASGGPDKIKKLLIGFRGNGPGVKRIDGEKEFEHWERIEYEFIREK